MNKNSHQYKKKIRIIPKTAVISKQVPAIKGKGQMASIKFTNVDLDYASQ